MKQFKWFRLSGVCQVNWLMFLHQSEKSWFVLILVLEVLTSISNLNQSQRLNSSFRSWFCSGLCPPWPHPVSLQHFINLSPHCDACRDHFLLALKNWTSVITMLALQLVGGVDAGVVGGPISCGSGYVMCPSGVSRWVVQTHHCRTRMQQEETGNHIHVSFIFKLCWGVWVYMKTHSCLTET